MLNSQYRQGKHGSINALLSGKGADLERMTIYAEKLSKARSDIISELEDTKVTRRATIIQTAPWGGGDQDVFFNAVAEIETELEPLTLLEQLQKTE